MFVLLAACLFLPAAFSQTIFTFSMIDGSGNATPLQSGGTIQFPPTPIGGTATVTIAMVNQGTNPDTVNAIFVDGPGFQLSGVPFPGAQVLPGAVLQFTVKFTPTQYGDVTAPLKINFSDENNLFTLAGSALGSAFSYQLQLGSSLSPLSPSDTIGFQDTPVGQSTALAIQVINNGNANGQIADIAVQGAGFQLTNPPFLPLTLAPGGTVSFSVVYAPTQAG